MEWTKGQVVTLIELFRERRVLWDQDHPDFRDKDRKIIAWSEIGEELQVNKVEAQNKMKNLTSQFHRESKKAKSGSGAAKRSKWFAYDRLQFLRGKTTHRHSGESGLTKVSDAQKYDDAFSHVDNASSVSSASVQGSQTSRPAAVATTTTTSATTTFHIPSPKDHKKRRHELTEDASEPQENTGRRDEFTVFGELVGHKLRKWSNSPVSVAIAQRDINDILFNLEMEQYAVDTTNVPHTHTQPAVTVAYETSDLRLQPLGSTTSPSLSDGE